jgi:hypothetical protein
MKIVWLFFLFKPSPRCVHMWWRNSLCRLTSVNYDDASMWWRNDLCRCWHRWIMTTRPCGDATTCVAQYLMKNETRPNILKTNTEIYDMKTNEKSKWKLFRCFFFQTISSWEIQNENCFVVKKILPRCFWSPVEWTYLLFFLNAGALFSLNISFFDFHCFIAAA